MGIEKTMEFVATPVRTPGAESVVRIQNKAMRRQFKQMSDWRVLWLVVSHLGYKRRVGLLISALFAYFCVDHASGVYNAFEIARGTLFG